MKIWGVIIKIHLSITITVSSVLTLSSASPGIEKPREILRHQQTHRPLFIDRRLIQHDPKIPSSGPFWSLAENKEFYEYKKPAPGEYQLDKVDEVKLVKVEASSDEGHLAKAGVEKPQIRHGRSRGHLGRPRKIEEPEIKSTFSSVALDQLKGYVDVNLFEGDGYNYENVEPIYSKLVGPNDTLYVDVDDFRVSNFTKFLSGDNDRELRRNLDRNSKPHFVEISRKNDKNKDVLLVHESSTRVHDVYGVLVHHPTDLKGGEEYVERVDTDYVYEELGKSFNDSEKERENFEELVKKDKPAVQDDIVTRFLRIIENQHLLGENCTAGTDLNLGEGVVDQYAQERFRLEANFAVNRANMLTRLWKYAPEVMLSSEYLLHASVLSMVEFDEDIFAAGNCYDKMQYKDHWLYCPFAHRLPDHDGVLVKDLAIEYKYLSNSSEWFYIARKNAERVIASNNQFSHGKFFIFYKIKYYFLFVKKFEIFVKLERSQN